MIPHTPEDIEQLNSFLRGELAAVETYDQCIQELDDQHLAPPLLALRHSHRERAHQLADRIDELGGDPDQHSGAWGGLVRLIEGGAKALGDAEAMAILERGESHGQADYKRYARKLSPVSRKFIADQYTVGEVGQRVSTGPDPWAGYFETKQSITKSMLEALDIEDY